MKIDSKIIIVSLIGLIFSIIPSKNAFEFVFACFYGWAGFYSLGYALTSGVDHGE